jgi:hypothetical protein
MHAERCPVCNSLGTLQCNVICHGCDGKGWVEVRSEEPEEPMILKGLCKIPPWCKQTKPEMEKKLVTNPEKSDG